MLIILRISETHLKEKLNDYFNIPGFTIEYTNRNDREKGGVCMFISDQVKYKLRTDLSQANSSFESCFIEIENGNKNVVVGIVYRSHTFINDFIQDIEPVAYRRFLAPGARSGISARFSRFFSQKNSKMVDPKLI